MASEPGTGAPALISSLRWLLLHLLLLLLKMSCLSWTESQQLCLAFWVTKKKEKLLWSGSYQHVSLTGR